MKTLINLILAIMYCTFFSTQVMAQGKSDSFRTPFLYIEITNIKCIETICSALPKSILRVKGCTKIEGDINFTYFERVPNGEVRIRPFNGVPITGSKLLTIGPGSEPFVLEKAIKKSMITKTSLK